MRNPVDNLYRQQKLKQQEELDGPCDCKKWRKDKVTITDSHSEQTMEIEVCCVCGKEYKS